MSTELLVEVAPSLTQPIKLPHVRELDGIRGFTALYVFLHHLLSTGVHPERHPSLATRALFGLSSAAGLRMDVFFVLSGFLITSILLRDRDKPHFYWNFYWKRALRILPLYLLTLGIVAACVPAARGYALVSFVFLTNFCHLFHIDEAGPFWTLAIEEHFYLGWPYFVRRLGASDLRRLAMAMAMGCLLLRLAAAAFGHHDFRFTFFHCDGLAMGALLACQRIEGFPCGIGISRWRRYGGPACLVLAGSLLTSLPLFRAPTDRLGMGAEALRMTGTVLLGYCAIRLSIEHTGSGAFAVLRSRTAVFFSSISYCMFLSNLFLIDLYDHILGPLATGTLPRVAARMLIVVAVMIAVCIGSHYLIERPAQRLRRVVLKHDSQIR